MKSIKLFYSAGLHTSVSEGKKEKQLCRTDMLFHGASLCLVLNLEREKHTGVIHSLSGHCYDRVNYEIVCSSLILYNSASQDRTSEFRRHYRQAQLLCLAPELRKISLSGR